MKFRIQPLALAVFVVLGSAAAYADEPAARSNSPEADAALYGESATLPSQATVCAERIAGYGPRFKAAYDAWRSDNAARIARGSKVVHDSATRAGVDADAAMATLVEAESARLRKTTPELLARRCQLMLDTLAPQAD